MFLNEAFATTPLDRESLPQGNLDIAERVRTNPFPWTGQFSPQLAEALLVAYAPRAGVILDPFAGSGTSLVEAARQGLGACGVELNPAAVLMARVYQMVNLSSAMRAVVLDGLRDRLFDAIGPPHGPLFSDGTCSMPDRAALEAALIQMWREAAPGPAQSLAAALVVLCDFYRAHLDTDTAHKEWLRIERTVRTLGMMKPESVPRVRHLRPSCRRAGTACRIRLGRYGAHLAPLYQCSQLSPEVPSLGRGDGLGRADPRVARSEIGSNRQNRGNRFLTVIQYALDMTLALREMVRVTNTGARLILVLGRESLVRGARFFNGALVAELAVQCVGLEIERRQERVFRNRYGADIYEDILHFRAASEIPDVETSMTAARRIAALVLSATRPVAPPAERAGIDDAVARIDTVAPSPIAPIAPSNLPA